MAIVADLSGNAPLDKSFETPNRTIAGHPNGVLTPLYAGERVMDTIDSRIFQANDMTNTGWFAITPA